MNLREMHMHNTLLQVKFIGGRSFMMRSNKGFRLWNAEAGCFLATSYRTFPNMLGRLLNDTI